MELSPELRRGCQEQYRPYNLQFNAASEVALGTSHINNQDRVFFSPEEGILLVIDGMGGMTNPQVAAITALGALRNQMTSIPVSDVEPVMIQRMMIEAMQEASRQVTRSTISPPNEKGMVEVGGATATAGKLFTHQGRLYISIAHVGDTGAEVLRSDGTFTCITQVDRGSENRIIVDQYLGDPRGPKIQGYCEEVKPGDVWVFYSDGIWDNLDSAERRSALLEELAKRGGNKNPAQALVQAALRKIHRNRQGTKPDDISVVTLTVNELQPQYKEYDLSGGRRITVQDRGVPVEVVLAGHPLQVGRGGDLGIDMTDPDVFFVVDRGLLAKSKGKMGIKVLPDGSGHIDLGKKDGNFVFGKGVVSEHCQVLRKGSKITITDISGGRKTVVRTPLVSTIENF